MMEGTSHLLKQAEQEDRTYLDEINNKVEEKAKKIMARLKIPYSWTGNPLMSLMEENLGELPEEISGLKPEDAKLFGNPNLTDLLVNGPRQLQNEETGKVEQREEYPWGMLDAKGFLAEKDPKVCLEMAGAIPENMQYELQAIAPASRSGVFRVIDPETGEKSPLS